MNPARADFVVDLAYGIVILVAITLILVIGTNVGVAFGLGVLVSYLIHIAWKMSRFDPDWMTQEVAERVEETVSREVETTVEETVSKEVDDVTENVEESLSKEVAETIEQTVSEEMDAAIGEETTGTEGSDRQS